MDIGRYWKPVVNTLREGLLIVDPAGKIIDANSAAEELTGYSSRELIGKSCRILNCTGCNIFNKGPAEKWCELFRRGGIRDKNCYITSKNKHRINVIKSATVLHDENGRIIGAVESLTDMTETVRQKNEINALRRTSYFNEGHYGMIGKSMQMVALFDLIDHVSRSDAPVMIHGASGTGKELVARAVHEAGDRKAKPYIQVNCAALNENLLESELFGHVKGAFTGAEQTRIGRFEAANGGTIFLDEIGDIPPSTQTKLLRVMEEKSLERVGDHTPVPIDVRIISATNKDLDSLIQEGLFREDLFFRINVFPLYCPALAERREDIPLIVNAFISRHSIHSKKNIQGITPEAMDLLMKYAWPGNVRELRNTIEYAFVLCQDKEIGLQHLPVKILGQDTLVGAGIQREVKKDRDREELVKALRLAGGNQSEAARLLNVSRVTVWKKIKKYGIDLKSDL